MQISHHKPKKRLAVAYKTYLKEANLIVEEKGSLVVKKPILDINLEREMKNNGLYPYLRIFLGGNNLYGKLDIR